ncbi:MAG: ECF transporter S component [Candidatus Bathyarchaeota archaeon]
MKRTKILTFVALMAALSIILSVEPFAIPITIGPFSSEIHFSQLPIFISGILAGPWAGLVTGLIGGLYMSAVRIPLIFGGLAILGLTAGFFAKKFNFNPFVASLLAWIVQAPYAFLTDYIWFVYFTPMPASAILPTVSTLILKLAIESFISAVIVALIVPYIRRLGLFSIN